MTYNTKSYEFTAFTEADLLQGVNGGSIGCGDVFTMPSNPSTCFTVTDDDGSLSGDKYRNEAGDDCSYQTASIEVDGVMVETNAKIYAESYHVLHGSDGKTYYMIEIEQRYGDAVGQGDDYFTFYGDVPPDGTTLTVGNTCNVTSNWVDYKCLSAGEKGWDLNEEDCTYTLEAEDMALWGYKSEYNDAASGDELIKLKSDVGYAKADFGGESGEYNVEICYVDENDGEGFIDVFINGQFVGCIDLSANNNGNGVHNTTFSSFVIEGVQINEGDEIKLKGRKDCGEYARIDKIVFEQVKEPEFRECDDPNAVKIDFNDLAAGDTVAAQFEDLGVTITAQRKNDDPNSENDAMVFDSANPTGGDTDLATASQGNVLIVSEDNDSSDPDDNIGGTVVFDFANPSFIFDLKVIDTEEGGLITLFDANGAVIGTVDIPVIGDGDIAQVLIDTADVSSMEVTLNGSGAIDDICIVPGEAQLGSLAGRYFCDTDGDDLDNNNGDEPGLNGLTVTLLNAAGGVVATTTTQTIDGVDGSYLFENLEAGDYRVSFETDPDGKAFVAQTAGDNDSIGGSDVDPTNGETGVISLAAGEDKTDVDAGVVELGSISGRYFCDTDGDDLDNGNGSEPGLNNIRVTLFDVDGGIVATQFTSTIGGVDGAYFFGDLAAGDYRVEFAADPDGKVFVAKNNDIDNDAIGGSDADPLDGQTDVINLSVGENVTDIDAGVVEPNQDPEPIDDQAAVCSDAATILAVLDNDNDPDGDPLTITEVIDAGADGVLGTADDLATTVLDGDAVTLTSGAVVSLNGGQLTYDVSGNGDAFDALEIGQEASDLFGYTVDDGNGGSTSAAVDIEVCGALNTFDSIARSFLDDNGAPIVQGTYRVDVELGAEIEFPVTVTANDDRITGPTGTKVFEDNFAYCIDEDGELNFGVDVLSDIFVSDPDNAALDAAVVNEENLDLVNWILNQNFEGTDSGAFDAGGPNASGINYSHGEVQDAIWFLTDDKAVEFPGSEQASNIQEIIDQATANGEGFEAGEGEIVGLVFAPVDQNLQTYIVGVPFGDLKVDCFCDL